MKEVPPPLWLRFLALGWAMWSLPKRGNLGGGRKWLLVGRKAAYAGPMCVSGGDQVLHLRPSEKALREDHETGHSQAHMGCGHPGLHLGSQLTRHLGQAGRQLEAAEASPWGGGWQGCHLLGVPDCPSLTSHRCLQEWGLGPISAVIITFSFAEPGSSQESGTSSGLPCG